MIFYVYIRYGFFFGQFDIYSQLRAEVNTAILEVGQTCHLRPTGSDIIVLRVWLAAEGGISDGLSLYVSIDWKPESMTYA